MGKTVESYWGTSERFKLRSVWGNCGLFFFSKRPRIAWLALLCKSSLLLACESEHTIHIGWSIWANAIARLTDTQKVFATLLSVSSSALSNFYHCLMRCPDSFIATWLLSLSALRIVIVGWSQKTPTSPLIGTEIHTLLYTNCRYQRYCWLIAKHQPPLFFGQFSIFNSSQRFELLLSKISTSSFS